MKGKKEANLVLKAWLLKNIEKPNASFEVKLELSKQTGLTVTQVKDWIRYQRTKIRKEMNQNQNCCI